MFVRISIAEQLLTLFDERGMPCVATRCQRPAKGLAKRLAATARRAASTSFAPKIGAGVPENTVFIARRPNGEIYSPELAAAFPGRDWILTRILWLSGCEPQRNRLGGVDTMRRYIYIHGNAG